MADYAADVADHAPASAADSAPDSADPADLAADHADHAADLADSAADLADLAADPAADLAADLFSAVLRFNTFSAASIASLGRLSSGKCFSNSERHCLAAYIE